MFFPNVKDGPSPKKKPWLLSIRSFFTIAPSSWACNRIEHATSKKAKEGKSLHRGIFLTTKVRTIRHFSDAAREIYPKKVLVFRTIPGCASKIIGYSQLKTDGRKSRLVHGVLP